MTALALQPLDRRLWRGGVLVWAALVAAALVLAATGLQQGARAYLTAWLALIAIPLGALPVIMLLELIGSRETALAAAARRLVCSLPILALLFLPVLFTMGRLYPWVDCHGALCAAPHYGGLAEHWFTRSAFIARSLGYLAFWLWLSWIFASPARNASRRRTAGTGLATHVIVGTLAAFDWYMSLDAGHVSSNYGVIVITLDCALALTAVLLLVARSAAPLHGSLVKILIVALCCAAFAQFVEFLVVWSANLPNEIRWFQQRATGGTILAAIGPVLLAVGCIALLQPAIRARRDWAFAIVLLVGAVELADAACLASPGGTFVRNGPETVLLLAILAGIAGFGANRCEALLGRVRHG